MCKPASALYRWRKVRKARVMSLSSVHFSSLLWRLRRLWQLWKWSFSQMSPKEGSQDRYDVCIQLMLVSPVPHSGSVSVHHALCTSRQPPTWVSVCDFSAYQCAYQLLKNFTLTSLHFFSTLPNQYGSLNHIILIVHFMFCCHALHHAFYRSKRLKTIRNMEEKPAVCFLLGWWGWESCV